MIALVSTPTDVHANAVAAELRARGGEYRLIDLSLFPAQSGLTIDYGPNGAEYGARWRETNETLRFEDLRVVWWRRPQPYTLDAALTGHNEREFAYAEAHSAWSGLWLCLDAFWINHPLRDEAAGRKVYQLKVAREVGLRVPRTCITNSVDDARAFMAETAARGTVYKAFSGTEQAWRETRLLRPGEVEMLADVQYAPVIFQEYIPAGVDLRITMIGEQVFPGAIHVRGTEYEVDFRMVMESARMEAATLPDPITQRLRALMQRLGLIYGAIDMRQTPDGDYVFLEINPAGQWLFVEQGTGLPITAALAELMLAQSRSADA